MGIRIKAVLFDLYGTLFIQRSPDGFTYEWRRVLFDFAREQGSRVSDEVLTDHLTSMLDGPPERLHEGPQERPNRGRRRGEGSRRREGPRRDDGLGTAPSVFERRLTGFFRVAGVTVQDSRVRSLAAEVCAGWQSCLVLDPDAEKVLARLQPHVYLALVTNYDHPPHVRRVVAESGLSRFFQLVVISGEVGVSKPDPAIFDEVLSGCGVGPESALYVGDSLVDYQAADRAGMTPVIVRRNNAAADTLDRGHGSVARAAADVSLDRAAAAGSCTIVNSLGEVPSIAGV